MINSMFFKFFGTVFSLKDLGWAIQNLMQVSYNSGSVSWWMLFLNIGLYVIFVVPLILFNKKWKFKPNKADYKIKKNKKLAFSLSMLLGSLFCFEFSLQMWCLSERKNNKIDINYVNFSSNYHFEKLGLAGYYTQETRQLMFDRGADINEIKEFMNAGEFLNDEYTGILENSNVIVILVETGDQTMLNPTTTPNLWKLLNNGVYCNQNYSNNHTDESNIISINGGHPNFHMSIKNKFYAPFNLPNALKNKPDSKYQTYFTTDLHSTNDEYHTMEFIKTFGFDNHWYHRDLIPDVEPWSYKYSNFTRDSIFMNALIEKIKQIPQTQPFYMQYLTIHMHMNHIINTKNQKMFEELEHDFGKKLDDAYASGEWKNPFDPNSEDGKKFRRWTLKTMDFDMGLGNLMKYLYESGSSYMQNTLLIPFGDHNWAESCSNKHSFAQNIKNVYDTQNIRLYSTVMGLYHPTLNAKFALTHPDHKLNITTTPLVITPTIMDLLGETKTRHNPRMYLNKSIFDPTFDNNEVFYQFANSTYLNEKFSSSNGYDITRAFVDDENAKNAFLKNMETVRKQRRIIDTIIKYNVFGQYNYEEFMPKTNIIQKDIIRSKEYW